MFIPRRIVEDKLKQILVDDIGHGDITVTTVIPPNIVAKAKVIAKENGVAAGVEEILIFAEHLGLKAQAKVKDGQAIQNQQVILQFTGDAQTILSVERTILNFLSRMSGIATKTKTLTEKLKKINGEVRLAATRKSAPGLLYFDKKAVAVGGGDPHRLHLDDMILIKDNHLAIVGGIKEAIKRAKTHASFSKKIEVEVTNLEDALKAAEAGADIVMLDNFSPKEATEANKALKKAGFNRVIVEASGGITAENLMEYAKAKVDIISLGELTQSVRALDLSLEIVKE